MILSMKYNEFYGPVTLMSWRMRHLTSIVFIGSELSHKSRDLAKGSGVRLLALGEKTAIGKDQKLFEPAPDHTIIIDSKGSPITHVEMLSMSCSLNNAFKVSEKDKYLSILPTSNILERACFMLAVTYGMQVGFD